MPSYELTVQVRTRYLPEQSEPEQGSYAFAYTITIRNTGDVPSQLISRHWVITDAEEQVQEVNGLGVVGHQPLLPPGDKLHLGGECQWSRRRTRPVRRARRDHFTSWSGPAV